MSKFAIIQIGPFQYNVEEGKSFTVPKFEAEEQKKLSITEVLAIGDGDKLIVGTPTVEKASVELEITEQGKGEKVNSKIYKAKSRYRRNRGLRKRVTTFKVAAIKYK